MFVPAPLLVRSLRKELAAQFPETGTEASAGQSLNSAIRLLDTRGAGGDALRARRIDLLANALGGISALLPADRASGVRALADRAAQFASAFGDAAYDDNWLGLLREFESVGQALATDNGIGQDVRAALTRAIGAWEIADRRLVLGEGHGDGEGVDHAVTRERMETYLRDRFAEPDLKVVAFQPLPGGFGKETILLEVEGKAINGGLVVRRDPITTTVDNDCHRVAREYPVMRAAFDKGFPAPDALWVDTDHHLLPGGDFLVMRRSPGKTGGNVFGASEALSDELVEVLASGVAQLHGLPPLTELGDLTNAIRLDRWDISLQEATRRYIRDWFDIFTESSHAPSPTLVSLYGWLFDNIPDAPGRPVLLHGDIGFHNMLIDQGQLSVLVDWEFAHIGDPAEDMAYIRNTCGNIPWDSFRKRYEAAGGAVIDPVRLHFFQVWGQVRNASASNLSMGKFAEGALTDLKLAYTGHYHFPLFIEAALNLIAAGPDAA